MKHLTLCADDFAQSAPISQAILELLERGRLSATSVMTQSPLWPGFAGQLEAFAGTSDIGLHLNLTHPFDDHARPLSYWLLRSQARCLPRAQIRDQLLRQIDLFTEHFQRLPDFIDGHQHVHAFPVIRDALFEAIGMRWQFEPPSYIRAPDLLAEAGDSWLKSSILKGVCHGFSRQLQVQALVHPRWFAGLYSLSPLADYPKLMQRWLKAAPHAGLIMCHPGITLENAGDPIGPNRLLEYCYLLSDEFAEDCTQYNVVLKPFSN